MQISCKYYIGIPVLSGINLAYDNTVFTYNDLTAGDVLNLDQVYRQMFYPNLAAVQTEIYPVSFGYRHKRNYYSFEIADKFRIFVTYPKNLIGFTLYGNEQFLGQTTHFTNLRLNTSYYREYSFGYSTIPNFFTQVGIRAKLLFGKANVSTGRSRFSLTSNDISYALHAKGKMKAKSSFPMEIVQNSSGLITNFLLDYPDIPALLFNPRNVGLAFDAGIIKMYNKNITLSASVLDLGFIRWSSDVNNVDADADFEYSGITAGTSFSSGRFLDELVDSLSNSTNLEVTRHPYFTTLPLRVYLGAEYQWKKNISLGAINRTMIVNRSLYSALTVSGTAVFYNRLTTTLNWSFMNNSFRNVGGGLAWTGRGFQFHIMSDNFLAFIQPFDTRTLDLQLGMNMMIGCPRSEREARLYNSLYGRIPGGNCNWIEKSRKKDTYLKRVARKRKY